MTDAAKIDGGHGGNRWRLAVWIVAAALWLVPLIAMPFTREVAWSPFDFAVFAVMLVAAAGTFDLVTRLNAHWAYLAATGLAVAGGFALIWVNLAVGIIGEESNPANLMFGGVLAVGIIGALIARFQPLGLSRTLMAMAVAQGLVAAIAFVMGESIFALTAVFAGLWLASAWLFRKAA